MKAEEKDAVIKEKLKSDRNALKDTDKDGIAKVDAKLAQLNPPSAGTQPPATPPAPAK